MLSSIINLIRYPQTRPKIDVVGSEKGYPFVLKQPRHDIGMTPMPTTA